MYGCSSDFLLVLIPARSDAPPQMRSIGLTSRKGMDTLVSAPRRIGAGYPGATLATSDNVTSDGIVEGC